MAEFVKSLDQKHLVTIGLEGFYGVEKAGNVGLNPGKWAASLGVDFIENSDIENFDFTSIHIPPQLDQRWNKFRRASRFSISLG
ncbi:mannan endo-1,4-beta-mannosidase 6-like [Solanum tuberosum]|uniref:mannan endo-1,4-beta-mannosidase 6-like n=1 Tax=Solanum tuberosum TaxID=4113 RepID=UPI00073A37A7|nr:PREDICTED: mannan endo-1,4-beta-mannosidase 6-like [Solanum tuberosum]